MKQAHPQQPARTAPHHRARRATAPSTTTSSPDGANLPDGAAGAMAVAPLVDAETRDAQLQRLAYARYVGNGCVDGHALDDWLAAEAALATLSQGGDGATDGRSQAF